MKPSEMRVKTYRDLLVWQKAMALTTQIYEATRHFPEREIFGLITQLRRCAVSIPSNIAEGYGRNSTADYVRFLQIAMGSLCELQTQMEISFNLQYWPREKFDQVYEQSREIERMLSSLIRHVTAS